MKIEEKIKNYSPGENVVQNILNESDYYEQHEIVIPEKNRRGNRRL